VVYCPEAGKPNYTCNQRIVIYVNKITVDKPKNIVYICNMEISERIQLLIEKHKLTASSFADRVGIQRSGLSHLFSGRNKPSLDLVMKIIEAFPDTQVEWLLWGKGTLDQPARPRQEENKPPHLVESATPNISSGDRRKPIVPEVGISDKVTDVTPKVSLTPSPPDARVQNQKTSISSTGTDERVSRLILIYPDGTFTAHKQRSE